ncbi:hypothetical protein Psed_0121 [Pseudonocardia dioxanivorans CB1190]|uniref:Uridine kinase n=1 Tax=Pseudonocardia dioxanivorans (strain ATCC 55486 / DSM 44775 / JCM 13855 / CB1190) TaxID=675635 RepID=F4CQG0_PSEUX|nr:uridine kinase [Pseudonocardia dioxanivorans]AEA22398.1 hypothetical protein Psed_0121 [Pseudonocardia dioxanivorans CB1190]
MTAAITPTTREALARRIADLALAVPGRVRVAVDGPPPTAPVELAEAVAELLRAAGRPPLVADARDWLRPASVRLEYGRTDVDMFLDGWLDEGALRRELLGPAGADGSGRVLRRFHDAGRDRAFRDDYTTLAADAVVVLAGELLLGRGLPFDLRVHLRMSTAALGRRLPADLGWTLPAHERYETERSPGKEADLLVLSDHPERPAIRS